MAYSPALPALSPMNKFMMERIRKTSIPNGLSALETCFSVFQHNHDPAVIERLAIQVPEASWNAVLGMMDMALYDEHYPEADPKLYAFPLCDIKNHITSFVRDQVRLIYPGEGPYKELLKPGKRVAPPPEIKINTGIFWCRDARYVKSSVYHTEFTRPQGRVKRVDHFIVSTSRIDF